MTVWSGVTDFVEAIKKEVREEVLVELRASMKQEMETEVKSRVSAELIKDKPNLRTYTVIKDLVNERFTRKDLGHRCNPAAVANFSQMVRDAFELPRTSHISDEDGEKAIEMTKEIIAVVDKYTRRTVTNEQPHSN